MWRFGPLATALATASAQMVWECQQYVSEQDDAWCKSVGAKFGVEFRYVAAGPNNGLCGDCACCKRELGPSITLTTTLSSTQTHTKTITETGTQTTTTETQTSTTNTSSTTTTDTTTSRTATSTTVTTTTITQTTITQTSTTITTTSTSTSTSTTGPHMYGGKLTRDTFLGWLSVWRSKYETGLWRAGVPDPWESMLPEALKDVEPEIVMSVGGVAGGIVTEGMGYGIMIEGFLAARGDRYALKRGLALTKSWLGLVTGPDDLNMPLGGGGNLSNSSTQPQVWPYGISAVEWSHLKLGAAGVPAWKFPIRSDDFVDQIGSAADGDQDAVLGMIYLAAALKFPADFVDMVIRTLIAFASADLGFPDLYRTLPDGTKMFVPKCGSMWGGLTPANGTYKANHAPWCYSPGYFAPAHYRTFRNFARENWRREFKDYLPRHMNGSRSSLDELLEALDSAVTAGYNILYYSSCESGTVSNWVGVQAPCEADDILNCEGVPWRHTPWVGPDMGTCQQSGTNFGSFGADASRTAWRLAMDYVLFREESANVTLYDRDGQEIDEYFGAQVYLNRIVIQYKEHARCDGGRPGSCMQSGSPFELAAAFDRGMGAPNLNCSGVPNPPESWWAGFMSYPTFSAFVAPYDEIGAEQMKNWMDTFASICDFTDVNKFDYKAGGKAPKGGICLTSYFEASQAVIALLLMAGNVDHLPPRPAAERTPRQSGERNASLVTVLDDTSGCSSPREANYWHRLPTTVAAVVAMCGLISAMAAGSRKWARRVSYMQVRPANEDCPHEARSVHGLH